MTFSSPSCRSLNHLKGSRFHHPKRGTSRNCQAIGILFCFDFFHPPKKQTQDVQGITQPMCPVHLLSGNVAASCQEFTNTRRYYASQQKKPWKANMEGVGSVLFFCCWEILCVGLIVIGREPGFVGFILETPEDVGPSEIFTSLRGVDTQPIWWASTIVFLECISPSIFINFTPTSKVRLPKRQYFTIMFCRDCSCWRFRHTLVSIVFPWCLKLDLRE